MRKKLALLFASIGWFAILVQLYLMMGNRIASVAETTIRFFSYFTILVNIVVAIYFTRQAFEKRASRPGTLTAITIYITIVGITYQLLLRHVWTPKGMHMVVNELLHSVIPVLVIIYWYVAEDKAPVRYTSIPKWLLFPVIYLVYTLILGSFTGWYPYHFLDVPSLGLTRVLITVLLLLLAGVGISALFIFLGHATAKKITK